MKLREIIAQDIIFKGLKRILHRLDSVVRIFDEIDNNDVVFNLINIINVIIIFRAIINLQGLEDRN